MRGRARRQDGGDSPGQPSWEITGRPGQAQPPPSVPTSLHTTQFSGIAGAHFETAREPLSFWTTQWLKTRTALAHSILIRFSCVYGQSCSPECA
jgi:hypothetical protein